MASATILVVDDDRDGAYTLAELLRLEGYEVETASLAADALEAVDRMPDLRTIVSDVRIPDLDGFMLLRVVKQRRPEVRVVLMTGYPIDDDDIVPFGATVLTKPVHVHELLPLLPPIE